MADEKPAESSAADQFRTSLHELATILREAQQLEPDAQEALADLMDELSKSLTAQGMPTAETAHLATSAASLARSLHERSNPNLLAAAKKRFEQAALRAEMQAPLAAGIAERVLDALANLGI